MLIQEYIETPGLRKEFLYIRVNQKAASRIAAVISEVVFMCIGVKPSIVHLQ